MKTIHTTDVFDEWFVSLADRSGKFRVQARIDRAELGNFGDCGPVGEGVSEMCIHSGAGYRVYYVRTGEILQAVVYVLLCGGNKVTQKRDIATAKQLARDFKKDA